MRRTVRNIEAITARLADDDAGTEVETGPSIASLLEPDAAGVPRYGRITGRVLRHLERLDEAVVGLARPLGVPVKAPQR